MKSGEEIVFRMTLRELLGILPASNFLQVERSTIINIMQITAFTDTTVCIKDKHFRISARKQKEIGQVLKAQKQELCKKG